MGVKKRWPAWIAVLLAISLLVGCSDAGSYVKNNYPLTDVQGSGKDISKIYTVEGKDVPTVAKELVAQEKPKEASPDSNDQMFLMYSDKLVNLQKSPENESNTLVEISTVEYVKNHYDNSFLQGYLTASVLQSLFGGGGLFGGGSSGKTYRGYTSDSKTYSGRGDPSTDSSKSKSQTPSTTDRSGSFNTKPSTGSDSKSPSSTAPSSSSGSSGSFNTKPSTNSGSTSSGSSSKPSTGGTSSSSSSVRKSDGSSPSNKTTPKTSSRSGSFSKKR